MYWKFDQIVYDKNYVYFEKELIMKKTTYPYLQIILLCF